LDVKILGISAISDYFAGSISQKIPQNMILSTIDPATLDNISSGLIYVDVNYFLKYD
jgi:hypothetical protein